MSISISIRSLNGHLSSHFFCGLNNFYLDLWPLIHSEHMFLDFSLISVFILTSIPSLQFEHHTVVTHFPLYTMINRLVGVDISSSYCHLDSSPWRQDFLSQIKNDSQSQVFLLFSFILTYHQIHSINVISIFIIFIVTIQFLHFDFVSSTNKVSLFFLCF